VVPTRSDFSRIAVINLILRNARSHLRDECPLTSKSVRLSTAAAIAAKCAIPLELGKNAEHLKHGLACWRGRIETLLMQKQAASAVANQMLRPEG
jgi:hypothetical protein